MYYISGCIDEYDQALLQLKQDAEQRYKQSTQDLKFKVIDNH